MNTALNAHGKTWFPDPSSWARFRRNGMLAFLLWTSGCVGPANSPGRPVPRHDQIPDLEWAFLGVCVPRSDWQSAFEFYTDTLGVTCHSRDGHWALLGAGWAPYVRGDSRGLVWELFERVESASTGDADSAASITPSFHLRNPALAVATLIGRGVRCLPLAGPHGTNATFTAPGGTVWELRRDPTVHFDSSLQAPEILEVRLLVENLPGQIEFYRQFFGAPHQDRVPDFAARPSSDAQSVSWAFQAHADGPVLRLVPGGHRQRRTTTASNSDPALAQPAFLGFMARDLVASIQRLKASGLEILRDVTHHEWGGTDCILADADGNAVQVFTLDTDHSFGSARPETARSEGIGVSWFDETSERLSHDLPLASK